MERNIDEFNKYAYDVIEDFNSNVHFNNDKICYLKKYMLQYPNCEEVIKLKDWIYKLIYKNLFNASFMNNLYNNKMFFYRLIELFVNRPFNSEKFNINEYSFISKLVEDGIDVCGCYSSQVEQSIDYLKRNNLVDFTNNYESKVTEFIEDDLALIRGSKDVYPKSFDESFADFMKYEKMSDSELLKDSKFLDYSDSYFNPYGCDDDIYESFKNKILSYYGEYCFFDKYSEFDNLQFISRDIGNGAGYDLYFTRYNIEKLIEVKATNYHKYKSLDDSFYISDNEYKVMNKVISSNLLAHYFVSRVFCNNGKKYNDLDLLYVGNDTFKCQAFPDIEYNIYFDKNKKQLYAKRREK